MIKFFSKILILIVSIIFILLGGFYFFQERILFRGDTTILSNKSYVNDYIEHDGSQIPVLYSLDDACDKVILFFHGNGGNIYTQDSMYQIFDTTDSCFMTIEYPGYGNYKGSIGSVHDLYQVGILAYEYLLEKGYTKDSIIPWGYSLGGGIASYIAYTFSTSSLVLQSTYTNLGKIAKMHFPFLPIKYGFKYGLRTDTYLELYRGKAIIFHGKQDMIVPYSEGLRNFQSVGEQQGELILFDGGHNAFPSKPFIDLINRRFK